MRIAFCVTCKGRAQHVKQTLPKNLADNAGYRDCVFIVLDYSSTDDLLEYLKSEHQADILCGKLVVYSFRGADKFKMAHAKNLAHRCGILEGADILVNLDADNYTGSGFARYIADTMRSDDKFLGIGDMAPGPRKRGVSGRIALHRHAYLNAGGYDERFTTWAPDDKDLDHRLRRMGYERLMLGDHYLECIRHSDKLRFKEYPHVACQDALYCEQDVRDAGNTVVNYGRFGLGTVYRNFTETPIELKPVPTRIFGIGMQKTGTTSLHHALTKLGYLSEHWQTAGWARQVWEEMQAGTSAALERYYAVSDLPMPILFRQLDQAYPGSKFILTLRDEGDWLRSARDHFSFGKNPERQFWDEWPFTHKAHMLMYGRKTFDEGVFLERYRRHTAEVLEHFRGRPDDLLVLTLSSRDPWAHLCKFLSVPVPSGAYPMANVSP
jgi:hypothetical protein